MGDSEINISGLLTRLLDAFNRHDLDVIMELFAEDAILDAPGAASLGATAHR
jgi:ketosteroid isomerase-like protein